MGQLGYVLSPCKTRSVRSFRSDAKGLILLKDLPTGFQANARTRRKLQKPLRNNLSNLSPGTAARPWFRLMKRHEIPLRNTLTIYPAHCTRLARYGNGLISRDVTTSLPPFRVPFCKENFHVPSLHLFPGLFT